MKRLIFAFLLLISNVYSADYTFPPSGGGGVGTITDVTATSPLSSSGGTTPDISVSGIISAGNGGTGNGFTAFTGPTTSTKTFTLPNATSTILTSNSAVTIAQGGTGQTSQTNSFDALSPTTTKGDISVHNGTDNIRVAVGSNDQVLTADSAQGSGVKWSTPLLASANNIFTGYNSFTGNSGGTGNEIIGSSAGDSMDGGGNNNTIYGNSAGTAITSGDNNTIIGNGSATTQTTNSNNTVVGYLSSTVMTGGTNSAFGGLTFANLSTGIDNVAVGYSAGSTLTSGNDNTFVGRSAVAAASSTTQSVAVGRGSRAASTSVSIGYNAGALVTGTNNCLIGSACATLLTSGDRNVIIGTDASASANSVSNSVGIGSLVKSSPNSVSIGYNAATSTTGSSSVTIGYNSGTNIISGNQNVIVGGSAAGNASSTSNSVCIGYNTSTSTDSVVIGASSAASMSGTGNICIGKSVAANLSTGTNNTIIGNGANVGTNSFTGTIALGAGASCNASNTMQVGSSGTPITMVCFGNGPNNATPQSTTIITTTNGAGSNIAGSGLVLAGGASTGNGTPGIIKFQVSDNTAGASSVNSQIDRVTISHASGISLYRTITTGGTTGDQTINKIAGRVNIAAAGSSITVTNSLCSTNSIIVATIGTNDATATGIKNVVPGNGSFVITLNAASTGEVAINWVIFN